MFPLPLCFTDLQTAVPKLILRSRNRLHPSLSGRRTSRPSGVMHLQIRILKYVQWASLYYCRHNHHHLLVASPPGKYFRRRCTRWALPLKSTVCAKSLKFISSPPFWLFSIKGVCCRIHCIRVPYYFVAQQTVWVCPYVCIFVSYLFLLQKKKGHPILLFYAVTTKALMFHARHLPDDAVACFVFQATAPPHRSSTTCRRSLLKPHLPLIPCHKTPPFPAARSVWVAPRPFPLILPVSHGRGFGWRIKRA